MGIAERIYSLVKNLAEADAEKVLDFAQNMNARTATVTPAQRQMNLAPFRQYRGRYNGEKIKRDDLYDRAGIR